MKRARLGHRPPERVSREGLAACFERERDLFARVYPEVARARLIVATRAWVPGSSPARVGAAVAARTVAWCSPSSMRVTFLARALTLPSANLVALIRHELGHLCDEEVDVDPGAEARADAIAREVTGVAIRYDAQGLQTLSTARGTRAERPANLHQ